VDVRIPAGASAVSVGWTLAAAGLIEHPRLFAVYTQAAGAEQSLKSGHYRFSSGVTWPRILSAIRRGELVTVPLTVPEGFGLGQIAVRIAALSGVPPDSVLRLATDTALVRILSVPGPTLEGYLFPDTYRFVEGLSPLAVLKAMTRRYREFWTPYRLARRDSLALNEREVVTLASIVEKEARRPEERPIIAGVYRNRLRIGMRLQADPTVQFALGAPHQHLLYSDIERVADNLYNTYTHTGLPPGPIASPGEESLVAALWPADVSYLFFVARPDGSHVFTRTEREHINAKNRIRRRR